MRRCFRRLVAIARVSCLVAIGVCFPEALGAVSNRPYTVPQMDVQLSASVSDKVDENARHTVLRTSMVFPRTVTMKERDQALVKAFYKCEAGSLCSFAGVANKVQGNHDVIAWGVDKMLQEIVNDLEKYQDDYHATTFDGFLIERDGRPLLSLQRKGSDQQGRTGFLEYNAYRHELVAERRTQRIEAAIKAIKQPSLLQFLFGASK